MAIPSGISAQWGFAAETTYGTAVTPTRFVPFISEGIESTFEALESEGIIAGQTILRSEQWSQGVWRHEGDVQSEVFDQSIGLLLHHILGSVSTTGTTSPYTHTFTPGDLTDLGLTMQVGRPDRTGTVRPFTFAGCKVSSAEIGLASNEHATLGLTVIGQTVTTGTALASASYAAIRPMTYVNGSFSLAGSDLCVRSATVSIENNLTTDRVCLGSEYIDEPVQSALREVTGEVELEFPDLVHWERFVAGTEGALLLSCRNAGSTASLNITANVRTDTHPVMVEGRDMVLVNLGFKAVGTDGDASAITMSYVSADSTP